jgi:hypothetical protein
VVILAAIRRFVILTALAAAVTAVFSLLFGVLIGSSANRSLVLGFYLFGSFLMVAGFFVGNRGPARVKSESAGAVVLPIPGFGQRQLRWATLVEQNEAINNSAVFVCVGLMLVILGVALDSRHSLF